MTGSEAVAHQDVKILCALIDEGVPIHVDDHQTVWIALKPAMRVLQVPRRSQRWLFNQIAQDREEFSVFESALGCCVPMVTRRWFFQLCCNGRTEAAHTYSTFIIDVTTALRLHGCYEPDRNHNPKPGEELDAIETRERLRDSMKEDLPWLYKIFYAEPAPQADDPWVDNDPRWEDDPEGDLK